jgi:hypothetical protein
MKNSIKTPDNTIILNSDIYKNSNDVDFELYNDILGKEKADAACDDSGVNTEYKGIYGKYYENIPIKIEYLKQILNELEKAGCNYISINYNCDHPDYSFYGVDVHAATESEISEINKKEKDFELKKAKFELKSLEKERLKLLDKIEKNK